MNDSQQGKIPFNPAAIINTVTAAAVVGVFVFGSRVAGSLNDIQKDLEYREQINAQLEARIDQLEAKSDLLLRRQRRLRKNVN